MTGRRTLLIGLTAALLLSALGWLVLHDASPSRSVELGALSASDDTGARTPVESAAQQAEVASAEPARDAAAPTGSLLETGDVDEFTADGLREDEPEHRPRTNAVGRVLDELDRPVAGANVLASTAETLAGAALDALANRERIRRAETDGEGRFRLSGLDPGRLRLEVHAPSFAPLVAKERELPPGLQTDVGDLRLARGVALAGRVVDEARAPVHAEIFLVTTPLLGPVHKLGALAASPLGESADDGRFDLPCVAPGIRTLLVRSAAFPEAAFEIEAPASVARVDDLELVLAAGAQIGGHVADYDEQAMHGLCVTAVPEDGPRLFKSSKPEGANSSWLAGVQRASVDANGRFTLDALAPGRTYLLRASTPAEADENPDRADAWAPVTAAPAGADDVEVPYLPGCRIDFEVVDRSTGAPIERLRVRVDGMLPAEPAARGGGASSEAARASSTSKPAESFFPGGRVSLVDLRATSLENAQDSGAFREQAGLASLTVEAPGYDTARLEKLRLEPGARLSLGMVQLYPLAILEVRVSDAESGAALSGARVTLAAVHPQFMSGRTRSAATSAARGIARLTSLSTADATLTVDCHGYSPARRPVSGFARFGAAPLEVALVRSPRVTVHVRDPRGTPASSVGVDLQRISTADDLTWGRDEITDADGSAVFTDLPLGSFEIAAVSRGGIPVQPNRKSGVQSRALLDVHAGDDLTVELEIQALSSLSGTIWIGRDPLARAQVSIDDGSLRDFRELGTSATTFTTARRFFTDAQGAFRDVELLPGTYSLLIEQRELGVRTLRLVQVEPRPTEVILDVDDTAITGTVFDHQAQPVAGARVQLFADRPGKRQDIRPSVGEFLVPYEDARQPIAETTTNAQGGYRLGCVPPGVPCEMFFSSGKRSASIARINSPQGRTLEHVDVTLPGTGGLEIVLHAPLAPSGCHYGVRVVDWQKPEGLTTLGADFGEDARARFDELPASRFVVMVCTLDDSEQILERRQPQSVQVQAGQTTELTAGW